MEPWQSADELSTIFINVTIVWLIVLLPKLRVRSALQFRNSSTLLQLFLHSSEWTPIYIKTATALIRCIQSLLFPIFFMYCFLLLLMCWVALVFCGLLSIITMKHNMGFHIKERYAEQKNNIIKANTFTIQKSAFKKYIKLFNIIKCPK